MRVFKRYMPQNSMLCILLCMTFALTSPYALAKESSLIRFPKLDVKADPNEAYVLDLLQLILKNTPRSYEYKPTKTRMLQGRAIYEMTREHGEVDMILTMTTDEREKKLIPIRIPVDKGLIGWRVALISPKNKADFSTIRSIDDLRKFTAGQEQDWPDVAILKANKLPVTTSSSFEPLFGMLQAGRFDYFPRSIFEVYGELSNHLEYGVHLDQNIILHYPAAVYFFVTPRRPQLAEDFRIGFEKVLANGSFEKLFQKHNQVSIGKTNIKQRTVIKLNNPHLNINSLPLQRSELWFQP